MRYNQRHDLRFEIGRLAQLVERFIYTEDVRGSSPLASTFRFFVLHTPFFLLKKMNLIHVWTKLLHIYVVVSLYL
jgi:hypothetical protein